MKWFKHENTFNNPKIEILTDKCGIIGYGVYFRILELIANTIEESNIEEWGYLPKVYDISFLAKKIGVTPEELEKIIDACYDLDLFVNKNGRLYCPKILERCDDYTQRLLKDSKKRKKHSRNKVGTSTEESPTKKRIEENRKEEDKNKTEESENSDAAPHVLEEKKYAKLEDLTQEDFEYIAENYRVPIAFVLSKYDAMVNWAGQPRNKKKIKGRNWYLTLMDWVRRDAEELRKEAHAKSNATIAYVGEPLT